MIYTLESKLQQLRNGCFKSGTGNEKVLIMGSCRTMAYLNYLLRWNKVNDQFTILRIDPFDWHWNEAGAEVDFESTIDALEQDDRVLSALRSTDIFIHEHFQNYGMFNTDLNSPKNIYQFGMSPKLDISIPNFHDVFVLHNDFAAFGNVPDDWVMRGEAAVDKFCAMCELTSFPEFGGFFSTKWREKRFFYTPNHISAEFSLRIFRMMNDKFLHLDLPPNCDFWQQAGGEDMFSSPCTDVHPKDIEAYGLNW